jgi:hypothetical protein
MSIEQTAADGKQEPDHRECDPFHVCPPFTESDPS